MDEKIVEELEREEKAARVYAVERGLSLRGLKVCEFMSEETTCFTATILMGGEPIGTASNEGHGGSTFISGLKCADMDTAELRMVETWVDYEVDKYIKEREDAKTSKWVERQKHKAFGMLLNCAVVYNGSRAMAYYTPAKSLEEFKVMKPSAKGERFDFFLAPALSDEARARLVSARAEESNQKNDMRIKRWIDRQVAAAYASGYGLVVYRSGKTIKARWTLVKTAAESNLPAGAEVIEFYGGAK